jgi:hypothetical protein
MSDSEMQLNLQAATIASSVLAVPVEAATLCEQVTRDMKRKASGFGGFSRGMSRASDAIGRAMPGTMGQMSRQIETADLPNRFILAVTRSQVYAVEERRHGDELIAGAVLKSWDRSSFQARRGNERRNAFQGIPDDRQVLILFLPIEGGGGRILEATARNTAAAGSPGFPHRVMVAKDAASQRLIDVLSAATAAPNVMIGGMSVQGPTPNARTGQPLTAQRLQELETLRATGVINDAEYARKREQIISEL